MLSPPPAGISEDEGDEERACVTCGLGVERYVTGKQTLDGRMVHYRCERNTTDDDDTFH